LSKLQQRIKTYIEKKVEDKKEEIIKAQSEKKKGREALGLPENYPAGKMSKFMETNKVYRQSFPHWKDLIG